MLKHASTSGDALVTEPSGSGGSFEELVEKRLIRRRNSFTGGEDKPMKRNMSFVRTPGMFMALMGDKDMSDPESLIDTDEDETTSKDSNQ